MLGPGQGFEHLDGGHDVVVDDFPLAGGQCAGANAEIFNFLGAQKLGINARRTAPSVQGANVAHALLVCGAHGFAANIGLPQKITFLIKRANLLPMLRPATGFGRCIGLGAQIEQAAQGGNLHIAFKHFKARINEADAIVNGLQLGRLVDHMHRCGDLAAVVQQTSNFQLIQVVVGHLEVGQRAALGGIHCIGNHHRQCWHTLAVAAGVVRLLVNRQVDEIDEGFKQRFQLRNQLAVGEGNRRLRGQ